MCWAGDGGTFDIGMAAHRVPYAATLSLAHPEDALRKLQYALEARGFRFIHILAPCPTGWKSEPGEGIELVRLAVRSGLYPVYEVFDGEKIVLNGSYFSRQGRFKKGGVDVKSLYGAIERRYRGLKERAKQR